ncbi:WD40 repeat-like protein [Coniophora puteana RWD-64-598 SS2]|uniref:WD40 repeat-like protein n=1 Tax=Coniophora puteana (strain RWD-64-598) TaxID=741705 RepID=A0A5M3MH93_CONPW|nr:WD40 repeat-like protein [Coniophora puteana RWD-64-598 SS2]EIW78473.1 WD40 repeat-like protein [Coniophora puteana RWD-64-598 SS2]
MSKPPPPMPPLTRSASVYAPRNAAEDDEVQMPRASDPNPRFHAKRKQTLLSLLNALTELTQVDDLDGDPHNPSFEDDRDAPSIDEQLQVKGAEKFHKFHVRITNLDKELRNFANASRQLGSSVGILSSAFRLRERLAQILFLFRENAADLFPRKVLRQPRESLVNPNLMARRRKRKQKQNGGATRKMRPPIDDTLDAESLPEQFDSFAKDVMQFLNCLNEFPEFTDEAVNASIRSFEGDLKYWACCLRTYKGQFKYPAVQRYIHDLTTEMGEHIDTITSTLSMFIEVGVPTIRFAQKHGASNLLNLSTVATFFSAVTATTLQFSYAEADTAISQLVNTFWFASLVFSIAAAVNSLLGLSWKQAMYRSPGHKVPWWVLIWIKRSPLAFLVGSVACFDVGLVLFTYSSGQSTITTIITTVFTAFTSFGLAAVSVWFGSEKWTFIHHRGQKWLLDVLSETTHQYIPDHIFRLYECIASWGTRRLNRAAYSLRRVPSMTASLLLPSSNSDRMDDDNFTIITGTGTMGAGGSTALLPYALSQSPEPLPPIRQSMEMTFSSGPVSPTLMEKEDYSGPLSAPPIMHARGFSPNALTSAHSGGLPSPPPSSIVSPRERFTSAVRSVMMLQTATTSALPSRGAGAFFPIKRRQRTASAGTESDVSKGGKLAMDPVLAMRSSRVATLVPKLRVLQVTQDIPAHSALVKHLQFSPSGKFLATSSWDRTSIIYRVGDPCTSHRILAHASGFVGQVAWSPTEKLLLTKLNRMIKVWTEDGVCIKTIDRQRAVQSVAWLPSGNAFMSVEGSEVVQLDIHTGKVLDYYEFDRVMIHDVAVTPDSQRLLGVGPITASPNGLKPSKSRVEKQLLVYNIQTKQIENQTPVLNDVRDITISRNGQVALISYENKAPPQLWKLEHVKARADCSTTSVRLTLRHTYMPKVSVDFAGPSYFGGKDDQLVLCAGKAGDIHIWDRQSAVLLHHVRAQVLGGDLTCIAWNSAASQPFMFATGSHDGAVRIWTEPSESPPRIETDAGSNSQANSPSGSGTSTPSDSALSTRSSTPVTGLVGGTDNQQAVEPGYYTPRVTTPPLPMEEGEGRKQIVTFAAPEPPP